MMAHAVHTVHFVEFDDYANEDDGDGSSQCYYTETDEDFMDEIREAHGIINNEELHKILAPIMRSKENQGKKSVSVAVQTDYDVSGIPPSWILTGEALVKDLHTGLTNVINSLYHFPIVNHLPPGAHGFCTSNNSIRDPRLDFLESVLKESASLEAPSRFQSSRLSFYTGFDYQERIINSEEFKRKLHSLKDTAERLGALISYLDASMPAESVESNKLTSKEMKSSYQQTDPRMMSEYDHDRQDVRRYQVTCCSKTDFTTKFSNLKIDFKASNHVEEKTKKKQLPEGHNLPKSDYCNLKCGAYKISKSCESINHLPPTVPKLKTQRSVQEPIEKYSAAVVRDGICRNQEKIVKISSQDKNAASCSSSKNFIKKNILALKAQSDAASSSKSTSHDTQRNLPSQKQRDKIK